MIPQGNCPQRPRLTPFQYVKLHHFLAQQDPAFEPRKEPSEVELASRALLRVLLAGNSDERASAFFQVNFDIDFITAEVVAQFRQALQKSTSRMETRLEQRNEGFTPQTHICAGCRTAIRFSPWLELFLNRWHLSIDCRCGAMSCPAERWDLLLIYLSQRKGFLPP
jgi:hypothetical protein